MFTFSFNTAFAAASGTMDANTYSVANINKVYDEVAKAQLKVGTDVEKLKADALYSIFAGKASKEFDNLTVSSKVVEGYYDSEVVAKVNAQAAKEASEIYKKIQEAINAKADYIRLIEAGEEGVWENANGEKVYNVKVVFSKALDNNGVAVNADTFTGVFSAEGTGTKANDVAKDAFAEAVSAKLAEIAAISEEAYVAKDQEAAKAAKGKASKQVTQLGNLVANGTFAFNDVKADGTVTDLDEDLSGKTTGFAGMLKAIYTPAVNEAPATGALVTELAKLTLSADEPTEAAKLAWARTQIMAKFEAAIDAEYDAAVEKANKDLLNESLKGSKANQEVIDKANETIANAKELKAAALEIVTYLVNDCDDYKQLIDVKTPFADSTAKFGAVDHYWNYANGTIASPLIKTPVHGAWYYSDLVKVVAHVKDLKDQAEALKADIAIDGTIAVDVDALLEEAIDDAYKTGATSGKLAGYTQNQVLHARLHALTGENCFEENMAGTTVKINNKEYTVVTDWNESNYEGARKSEVKKIKKETKAAIMEAKTVADAETAFLAGLEKYKAVLDKDDKAMNQSAKAFNDLKKKYIAQLTAELNYVIAGINAAKANNAPAIDDYVANLTTDLEKAYTVDELTEKYNELSAEVKALKSKDALDAEKKALEERCKAYSNKTVTVEDKADLIQLRKDVAAFRTYVARLGGTTPATYVVSDFGLDLKLKAVALIEKKAVEEAYKVINKDGKATLDEAKAVAELRAAVDAYNDSWDLSLEDRANFSVDALSVGNLKTFEKEIFLAEVDNVETMVAKLPANASNTAGIKAARKAYEALSLCQKVLVAPKYYDKLVDTEKLVSNGVESMKLRAYSKYAKKGITVKWVIEDGRKSDAKGYQVWRSTKANSGYKKLITVKPSYGVVNAKNLKKGVTYYYKVRAYNRDINGKLIFSDWSNKAYRKAK